MNVKLLITAIAVLSVTACAKAVPPQAQAPQIPIILVNVEKSIIAVVPERPSTTGLIHIRSDDPADVALSETTAYTEKLQTYATEVTEIATECKLELDDRDARLNKIKQYILLSQPRIQ